MRLAYGLTCVWVGAGGGPRRPPGHEAEEAYGDYVDVVETGTEVLADLRDAYAATLPEEAAEEYDLEFNRAVARRLPRFGLEIENR